MISRKNRCEGLSTGRGRVWSRSESLFESFLVLGSLTSCSSCVYFFISEASNINLEDTCCVFMPGLLQVVQKTNALQKNKLGYFLELYFQRHLKRYKTFG